MSRDRNQKRIQRKLKITSFGKEHPELIPMWSNKNDKTPFDYLSGSKQKVFWKCLKCGYEYTATVQTKSNGHGCRMCTHVEAGIKQRKNKINKKNNFKINYPEIAKEWHLFKNSDDPSDYSYSSNKKKWWMCSKGHEWQASINNRVNKSSGCPYCGKQSSKPELRILSELETIFELNHRVKFGKIEIDIFIEKFSIGIEFDGFYYHKNRYEKDIEKDKFFLKKGIQLIRVREDPLKTKNFISIKCYNNKVLKKDINNLLDKISKYVDKNCKEKIKNYKNIKSFTNEIIYKKYLSYFPNPNPKNSFKYLYPEVSKFWHPTLNGLLKPENFTSGSDMRVWWSCDKGHEWQGTIKNLVRQRKKCYQCYKENNCVQAVAPHLIDEVHPTKNKNIDIKKILKSSSMQIWWIGKCGHIWRTTIASRAVLKTDCAKCVKLNSPREKNGKFKRI